MIKSPSDLGSWAKRPVARDAARVELDLAEEGIAHVHASVLRHRHLVMRRARGSKNGFKENPC